MLRRQPAERVSRRRSLVRNSNHDFLADKDVTRELDQKDGADERVGLVNREVEGIPAGGVVAGADV